MNYRDLKGKTIFDFAKDERIIEEIVDFKPSDKGLKVTQSTLHVTFMNMRAR